MLNTKIISMMTSLLMPVFQGKTSIWTNWKLTYIFDKPESEGPTSKPEVRRPKFESKIVVKVPNSNFWTEGSLQ